MPPAPTPECRREPPRPPRSRGEGSGPRCGRCEWGADMAATATRSMDRLLFGDNQFFGVNHMSEEKARAQQMRFQDIGAVIDVLDAAYDEGVTTFMCTTHDRIALICDHVRANPERYSEFTFFPGMPYAHKYANAV